MKELDEAGEPRSVRLGSRPQNNNCMKELDEAIANQKAGARHNKYDAATLGQMLTALFGLGAVCPYCNNEGKTEHGEDDEKKHPVTVSDFYIGKYEVTFDEYDIFCDATKKSKPSDEGWGRGRRPVMCVNWFDAVAYCNWLSEQAGIQKAYDSKNYDVLLDKNGNPTTDTTKVVGYRLPTEAEWEYAARGGNRSHGYTYSGSDNIDEVAWYRGNSGGHTHWVGTKAPNELGIYDMSGDMWEWCHDWYKTKYYKVSPQNNPQGPSSGSDRVLRGGSWGRGAGSCRVAYRVSTLPDILGYGFRVAR